MAAVGAAAAAWPFIDQMNPSAAALALSTVEVDLAPVAAGQQIVVKWRGQPLFIRHRTPALGRGSPLSAPTDWSACRDAAVVKKIEPTK